MLLAVVSCTTTEYVDIDNIDPILVLNAQLSSGDSTHMVHLGASSRSQVRAIKGASVDVSINDAAPLKALLIEEEESTGHGGRYSFKAEIKPGDKVLISATDGVSLSAQADVTVPKAPDIVSMEMIPNVKHSTSGSVFDLGGGSYYEPEPPEGAPYAYSAWHEIKLTLRDFPSEDSFYRLSFYLETTITEPDGTIRRFENGLWMDTDSEPVFSAQTSSSGGLIDELVDSYNTYNVFSDAIFQDKEYSLKFFIQENNLINYRIFTGEYFYDPQKNSYEYYILPEGATYTNEIVAAVYSITKDQYYYLKALDLNENFGILFSEPVSIPSNVTGGLGFVTVDALTRVSTPIL